MKKKNNNSSEKHIKKQELRSNETIKKSSLK